jgi:cell division protein FtsZ
MTNPTDTTAQAPPPKESPAIKVIGVGGAGLQALEQIAQSGFAGLGYAVIHTDARRLAQSSIGEKLLLGAERLRGLSAGGDPDVGQAAAEAEAGKLRDICAGADLLIVVAGLGGGTGSGAAPVVARLAREQGTLVLALAVLPFDFEGRRRRQQAQDALRRLKTAADAVICLPNQKVAQLIDEHTTLFEAFKFANQLLAQGVGGLWCLLQRHGLINVDFADLCHVVRGRQAESCFAAAQAQGEHRARDVLAQLFASPMLDGGRLLAEADAVLVSVAGGLDLTLKEVNQVMDQIKRRCENAQLVVGAAVDAAFNQRLAVTLVAAKRNPPDAQTAAAAVETRAGPEPLRSELPPSPLELDTQHLSPPVAETGGSQLVPPAPELTAEQTAQLLAQRAGAAGAREEKARKLRQGILPLEIVSKGRFARSEPTVHRGADLDLPTYIRRNLPLN